MEVWTRVIDVVGAHPSVGTVSALWRCAAQTQEKTATQWQLPGTYQPPIQYLS